MALHAPAINFWRARDGALLEARLPGVRLDCIDLRVAEAEVSLSGVRHALVPAGARIQRRECPEGPFHRAFPLPHPVDPASARARLANGIFRLSLAWSAPAASAESTASAESIALADAPEAPVPPPGVISDSALAHPGAPTIENPTLKPPIDILETAAAVYIMIDAPGFAAKDITLARDGYFLILRLPPPEEPDIPGADIRREYGAAARERQFRLPAGLDIQAADAAVKDGVLAMRFPKL